jgi:hypothetical protein
MTGAVKLTVERRSEDLAELIHAEWRPGAAGIALRLGDRQALGQVALDQPLPGPPIWMTWFERLK